ncbi:glycoside hydrolase domain-containing protein [Pseudogracilibacillus sp. SO30301A]|uniref:glycoside hydrolase domain-containing protein n=1 Tax=Pseudogracilibacillus sp. SO30301A TaxID=3098291 RepID=UPI00300E1786
MIDINWKDWIIALLCFGAIYLIFSNSDSPSNQTGENGENSDQSQQDVFWGVDSANAAKDVYKCVSDNFGEPKIFGRYLGDVEGVATSLDQKEVKFLHDKDIKILVIYNLIPKEATGFDNGVQHAEDAIELSKELKIPEGIAIFGDIEPDFSIDSKFIEGWYKTISDSAYEPGLYGVFDKDSDILVAFEDTDEEIQENTIVWTAYPQKEPTSKENAPEYEPQGPEKAKIFGWQYAIDAETCNIDTNVFTEEMLDYVW